jgi:hypothetical protein
VCFTGHQLRPPGTSSSVWGRLHYDDATRFPETAAYLPSGGTVARAKRTDRAEARRRYRATLSDDLESTDLDDQYESEAEGETTTDRASAARSRSRATSTPLPPARPARPSVVGAFRSAFHAADLRADLRALPSLLVHRAFLIPLALIAVVTAIVFVTGGAELISAQLAQFVIGPQPVAAVFLAGFLATRASYLIGGILGVIGQLASVVLLASPAIQASANGQDALVLLRPDILASSFLVAIFFGAFYAAAAAWYKRFLALASPSRAVREANRPTGKPSDRSRRRGSDDRPLLARRR